MGHRGERERQMWYLKLISTLTAKQIASCWRPSLATASHVGSPWDIYHTPSSRTMVLGAQFHRASIMFTKVICSHSCLPCLRKKRDPEHQSVPPPSDPGVHGHTWVPARATSGNGSLQPLPSEGTASTGSLPSSGPWSG